MKQQAFEKTNQMLWQRIEDNLALPAKKQDPTLIAEFYLVLCQHLALAKQRLYEPKLIGRLNKLVLALYREMYRHQTGSRLNFTTFFVRDFPLAIYHHRVFIAWALLFFLAPLLLAGLWTYFDDSSIYHLMSHSNVRGAEKMYDPAASVLGRERQSETNIFMFGFYIMNNIGIAFKSFASGVLVGIGSILIMIFNGLSIGGLAGHLTRLGFIDTFYPFVAGHGSFELTAIVFSGGAGLKLGYSLINPGIYSRLNALKMAGRQAIPLLYGIIFMLLVAAFIEAFWSSSTLIPVNIKYIVGAILWLIVLSYTFSGRRFEPR